LNVINTVCDKTEQQEAACYINILPYSQAVDYSTDCFVTSHPADVRRDSKKNNIHKVLPNSHY
jgi:hypothetical protein